DRAGRGEFGAHQGDRRDDRAQPRSAARPRVPRRRHCHDDLRRRRRHRRHHLAENMGVMAITRIYSTALFVAAAIIAILLGFSPKFGALIQTIPGPVLGGLSIVVFGLIAATAGRIWVENGVDFSKARNLITVAVALGLGAGNFKLTVAGFTLDGIGTATFGCIILYHLLRGREEESERI